jgi:hypothetical protein
MRGLGAIIVACAVGLSMGAVLGLDPLNGDDSKADPDGDGLNNLMEFVSGTDPYNPDTDNGGADDGWEAYYDRNRAVFDSDSAKARFDSDGDGLKDVNVDPGYKFDPANGADERDYPDSDGWNNLQEYFAGTDPTNPDTDGDLRNDDVDPNPLIPDIWNIDEIVNETGTWIYGCGTWRLHASGQSQNGRTAQGEGLGPVLAASWDSYFIREL